MAGTAVLLGGRGVEEERRLLGRSWALDPLVRLGRVGEQQARRRVARDTVW